MSNTLSIEQASAELARLVRGLGPEDEIIITDSGTPVARIVPEAARHKRTAGTCKGMIEIVDDGDDAILDHFKEHLP